MSKVLKWGGVAIGAVGGLVLLAVVLVFVVSEMMLDRTYPAKPDSLRVTATPAAIAQGRHLARVAGCEGCHRTDLTGAKMDDVPGSTVYAPNLTLLGKLSDADLDRILRQSRMPDGRSVVVMPTRIFAHLTDGEAAAIIAYLRTLKPHGNTTPDLRFGLMARAGLIMGMFDTEMAAVAKAKRPLDLGPRYAAGRHITQVICAGCHGTDLGGQPKDSILPSPDLMIVAGYSREQFRTLMRTGKAAGGRDLGLMSLVARADFTNFSDAEVDALYDYLGARASALLAQPGKPAGRK